MHSCQDKLLKKTCPICKIDHEITFKDEFNGHTHYLIGFCPNCNYKICIKSKNFTSGIAIETRLGALEGKVSDINILLSD